MVYNTLDGSKKLVLYGLYKQATKGDITRPPPSFFNFRGRRKWNAWNAVRGTQSHEAMKQYIRMADEIKEPLSLSQVNRPR